MVDRIQFEGEETGATPPTPPVDPNRPEWLDPKFKTPEDQAKAYKALEAEFTRIKQGKPETAAAPDNAPKAPDADGGENKPDATEQKTDDKSAEDQAIEAAQAAGVDFDPYVQEFATTGDVKDESRMAIAEALAKVPAFKGLDTRDLVDKYVEGSKHTAVNDLNLITQAAGGDEQFAAMKAWASQPGNVPREQLEAYNRAVTSNDRHAAIFAVESLKAKFEAANTVDPRRKLEGNGAPTNVTQGYSSTAEMTRDMADPRYATDEAYRNMVREKIRLSKKK
ncbi:MAG: capsid assembly protein [Aeromicrobium sp.]